MIADKLGDLRTANMAIDRLISLSDEIQRLPCKHDVKRIYEETSASSPLRRLLVDHHIHELQANSEIMMAADPEVPKEFYVDVMRGSRQSMMGAKNMRRLGLLCVQASKRPKCYYHQHDEEHPQARCE